MVHVVEQGQQPVFFLEICSWRGNHLFWGEPNGLTSLIIGKLACLGGNFQIWGGGGGGIFPLKGLKKKENAGSINDHRNACAYIRDSYIRPTEAFANGIKNFDW